MIAFIGTLVLGCIAQWYRQRIAACLCVLCASMMVPTLLAETHGPVMYVATYGETEYHDPHCWAVAGAVAHGDELQKFYSLEEVQHAGLTPHRCADDQLLTREITSVVAMPAK